MTDETINIGATLKQARRRAQLDIAELEDRSKIRAKYLRALEDEQWDTLPGYAYAKAFLRTYADMLGLDSRALVAEFKRQFPDPSELELTALDWTRDRTEPARLRERAARLGRTRELPRRTSLARAAAVLVVLVAALYGIGELTGGNDTSPTAAATTTTKASTTKQTHSKPLLVAQRPRQTLGRSGPSLQLVPTGSVYVCLVSYPTAGTSDADIRVNGILTSASPRPVYHAANHFLVTFGNNLIRMVVDGYGHKPPATPAVVVSFEVGAEGGYHEVSPSQAPYCP